MRMVIAGSTVTTETPAGDPPNRRCQMVQHSWYQVSGITASLIHMNELKLVAVLVTLKTKLIENIVLCLLFTTVALFDTVVIQLLDIGHR